LKSLTAKDAKVAEEKNNLTAKEIIIVRTRAKPEDREGNPPRVAYRKRFRIHYYRT
jgi:hypothetical protein